MKTSLTQEQAFLGEIGRQIRFAMQAVEQMNTALRDENARPVNHGMYWPALQDFVLAAAQISKMLWPNVSSGSAIERTDRANRGIRLRELLDVADDSALLSRKCRNHLEHFDERIDVWLGPSTPGHWADFNVFSGIGDDSPALKGQIRALNLSTGSPVVFGEAFQLQPIINELGEVWQRLPAALKKSREDHKA